MQTLLVALHEKHQEGPLPSVMKKTSKAQPLTPTPPLQNKIKKKINNHSTILEDMQQTCVLYQAVQKTSGAEAHTQVPKKPHIYY